MKKAVQILYTLFVISAIIFVLAAVFMFLVQCFALVTLNGTLSQNIYHTVIKTAGPIAAVPVIIAIISGYISKTNEDQEE